MAKYFPSGERQTEDIGFLQGVCVWRGAAEVVSEDGDSGEGDVRREVVVTVVRVMKGGVSQ